MKSLIKFLFVVLLAGVLFVPTGCELTDSHPASNAPSPASAAGANQPPGPARHIRAALYWGPGTFGPGPGALMKALNAGNAATSLTEVSPEDIRAGVLSNFDVVIFAGGSGSEESAAIGREGRAEVRKFVANGGGYIGICAGAYLATSGLPWSLHLINARILSPKWQRGKAVVKLEITPDGKGILGAQTSRLDCLYHNGPVVGTAGATDLPPFQTLALFRSEVSSNDAPAGIMVNSPAIFAADFKQGKVLCFSPVPEQTGGLDYMVLNAVNWVKP
jgi:putative intracellular protease/amidase